MQTRKKNDKYMLEIKTLVQNIPDGDSILNVSPRELELIGLAYGFDMITVLEDCMNLIRENNIYREISSGHVFHNEALPPKEKEELIGIGMISDDTDLFFVDEFIELVRTGCFNDYDGNGEFVSGNGEEFFPIRCHVEWLEEFRDEWPYIAWYNK